MMNMFCECADTLHYRFSELKSFYGIEDEKPSSTGATGPQTISSGLLCMDSGCKFCASASFSEIAIAVLT